LIDPFVAFAEFVAFAAWTVGLAEALKDWKINSRLNAVAIATTAVWSTNLSRNDLHLWWRRYSKRHVLELIDFDLVSISLLAVEKIATKKIAAAADAAAAAA
jgi:hypothetical protein